MPVSAILLGLAQLVFDHELVERDGLVTALPSRAMLANPADDHIR